MEKTTIEDTIEKYIYALLDEDGGTTAMPSAFRKAFKDIYNVALQDLAEKSIESIDKQITEETESEHPAHEMMFGMSISKNKIKQAIKELTKMIVKYFCCHKWNLLHREEVYGFTNEEHKQVLFELKHKIYDSVVLLYSCEKCGKIHKEKT